MFFFQSIKELINTLSRGKDLLSELFGKRKTETYNRHRELEYVVVYPG